MLFRQPNFSKAVIRARVWCVSLVVLVSLCTTMFQFPVYFPENGRPVLHGGAVAQQPTAKQSDLNEHDPLQYIPAETVNAWRLHDFTVAFGVPSEDIEARRRRRYLQRTTCWQYDGVATKKNKYNGTMIVLYILGRSPLHQHKYSTEMIKEAEQWQDVILFDFNESHKTTNKAIGVSGSWGVEASIGQSLKTFRWLDLALRMFPRAQHIGKGDDDMFLRVPQYLADFRLLPPRGVYWGLMLDHKRRHFGKNVPFTFAFGFCTTLERSAVEAIVRYDPLRRLAMSPYQDSLKPTYRTFGMRGDDLMVGLALKLAKYKDLALVREPCRFFYDTPNKALANITADWVVLHHVKEKDYQEIMDSFADAPVAVSNLTRESGKNSYAFFCLKK